MDLHLQLYKCYYLHNDMSDYIHISSFKCHVDMSSRWQISIQQQIEQSLHDVA